MIPYARQDVSEDDIEAACAVLRSDWLTQGPAVERFESALADACGVRAAIACTNATSALHLACSALGLGPGDTLWTSPITFVASANCARYCGAEVDFVDIDPRTYNLSVAALAEKLERAQVHGSLPKVVVAVHFAGQSCPMRDIRKLQARYGFRIIEDAAHALGGSYLGEPVGKGTYSDITVFSFHPVKIITTGEGGAAVTNDQELASRMRSLRSHGITRDETASRHGGGAWYYEQRELGWNYRMTDLQAALGWSQLKRLKSFIERRREIAARYGEQLKHPRVVLPWQSPEARSAYHLYPIRVASGQPDRRAIYEALVKAGIRVNVHYIPVYLQPYYRSLGFVPGLCPEAERYYTEAISLPMFSGLTEANQQRVIDELRRLLE